MIIQGGMGIAVSDWRLARAVACSGQLGVVSGTAIDTVLVRRLQDGDLGGHVRRAMAAFPIPSITADILRRYFREGGRTPGTPYALLPMYRHTVSKAREAVTVMAAFVEVFLAREGHDGLVGINLLTKVQLPNPAALYGAMLAGVNYVLMGAGIPREIPGVLQAFTTHQPSSLRLELMNATPEQTPNFVFRPADLWDTPPTVELPRPRFLPIVSSNSLATLLAKKNAGGVDGFVVEGPTAGGHNAPPRGAMQLDEAGQPIYGARDEVSMAGMRELGLPFWLAGGSGHPEGLTKALAEGAAGIQVGTLFAYCNESGLESSLKRTVLAGVTQGQVSVRTDPLASPTGYPFKVVQLQNAPPEEHRERICDLGYLRTAYLDDRGKIGFRCPAEPIDTFETKGGAVEETTGRRCLCNALMADIGLGQVRGDGAEPPIVTSGDDLTQLAPFLAGRTSYSAQEAIAYLTRDVEAARGTSSCGSTPYACQTEGDPVPA